MGVFRTVITAFMLLITGVLAMISTSVAEASEPPEELISEIDLKTGIKLLLELHFTVQPDSSIDIARHYFRQGIPRLNIGRPWIWAARSISFENKCLDLKALEDPRIMRLHSDTHEEWARREEAVNFIVELVADPHVHELEIIDSDNSTVGKFDIAQLFDGYCTENPDDPLCFERTQRLIMLDDPGGLEEYGDAVLEDFSDTAHMGIVDEIEAGVIFSTADDRVRVIDLASTSQYSPLFETSYAPFESDTQHVVYNGHSVISDEGVSRGKNLDRAVRIAISDGALGLSMTLGSITYDSIMNRSDQMASASKEFDQSLQQGDYKKIRAVAESITAEDRENVALISVFDTDGKKIEDVEVVLSPVPGFHTFAGFITPHNTIGSIEIEYVRGIPEEAFTDLLILPSDAGKLPSENFSREYKACPGEVGFRLSHVGDIATVSELRLRDMERIPDDEEVSNPEQDKPAPVLSSPTPNPAPYSATPKPESQPRIVSKKEQPATTVPPESRSSLGESKTENPRGITSCNAPSDDGYVAGNIGLLMFPLALYVYRRMPRK